MTIIRTLAAAATLAAAFTVATPASAVIETFANFTGVGGSNIYWQQSVSLTGGQLFSISRPGDNSLGSVATRFRFESPNPGNRMDILAALGQLSASFTLNVTAADGSVAGAFGRNLYQPLTSGTFSFIYTGLTPLVVAHTTYRTGANLLSAIVISHGGITGTLRGSSGSVNVSTTAGDSITYTSDFLNFGSTVDQDFAVSLSSATPPLGVVGGQSLNTFFATAAGTFSTDPVPLPTAVIPEPATWGLLVVGFGLVGLQGRRRSRSTSVAA